MMHVMFLSFVALVIGVIVRLEWPSLQTTAMKSTYLIIVITVFVITVTITFMPELPGPLQGIKALFKPLTAAWMSE
ncbi:hypothetical protein DFQ01_101133 [Paenibacillus cellulosilyticus]|uniref:Uncharacterized protein n=1 Tax=Paenibacillus cellulosilyticus TaxID=375489 RepID=A0A2V2Z0V0_9BACL|nr:hypothetical protein [Paenibacillus cellulosilyticus]PWW08412.1 hypothetical protein DFQ01_101133 [Paenibacillus cellulosilyticus]QKS48000.1 hypothetical protein HUB94_27305 [Paenibacillus cellulosilyticus]